VDITVGDVDLPMEIHRAEGERVLLWLPSEHGLQPAHTRLAAKLATRGIESWIADPLTAYFLPTAPSSMDAIPAALIADLIEHVRTATGKTVYLASNDRGGALALYGAQLWQQRHPGQPGLGGAVLITPYLLAGTPPVGAEAEYLPIAEATNLALYLIQPARSPTYWRLAELTRRLEAGGSDVFLRTLAEARDRFFFRGDALPEEQTLTARLPAEIDRGLRLLASRPAARQAVVSEPSPRVATPRHAERRLQAYAGAPAAPDLRLEDVAGASHRLGDYRGEVVLVNFWASWCPPCVHEMPSMQALSDRLDPDRFEILAVNLAEPPGPVRTFVAELDLRFTVLLDPAGEAIAPWRVFAYPTSYVIDKQGRIRYALFGAIDWLEPETVATIQALIEE
jgi:thiol-disulfide isomerase/thioredoxin